MFVGLGVMNLLWLLFAPFMSTEEGRPQVVHVWNASEPLHVELDNIFLSPRDSVDYFRQSSGWPEKDLYIDARRCQRARQVQIDNADRLECVAKVTAFTTELLGRVGLDAFLIHGSLLGWYRHNGGQIPWDLDGDTAVIRSQCEEVVGQYEGKAICDVISESLPDGYFLYAIDTDEVVHPSPKGSDFAGCDVPELRVGATIDGQWCHTDVFMLSDDADDGLCVPGKACFQEDQILPLKNASSLVGKYPVKIPAQPEEILSGLYNEHYGIMNMHGVPKNYAFQDDWAIVIGDELDDTFKNRVMVDRPRLYEMLATVIVPVVMCCGVLYIVFHNRRRESGFIKLR